MKKNKRKILFIGAVVVLLIIVLIYANLIHLNIYRKNFAKENERIHKINEEQVFKVDKIILCSSANAIDLSEEKDLQDLNLYQYTDIAIYLDNGEELSKQNTVKELYIDNIRIDGNNSIGQKSLTYKNTLNFGLKEEIDEAKDTQDINFNIVHTNQENNQINYNEATFFTDCSNPITLEYLNYDIKTGFNMEENKSVVFDGSILKEANVSTKDIECKVRFKINIINNEDQKYSCPINIQIPLKDIYKGTTMKAKNTDESKYIFFRES